MELRKEVLTISGDRKLIVYSVETEAEPPIETPSSDVPPVPESR